MKRLPRSDTIFAEDGHRNRVLCRKGRDVAVVNGHDRVEGCDRKKF